MKLVFTILLLLPLVFSMPQKRLIFDAIFGYDSLKDLKDLPTLVDGLVGTLGTDATEQDCETKCHTLKQDHLLQLQFECPLICKNFQSLVHHFGHPTSAPMPMST
ncbi:uncharacterized protein LOC127728788 [Mytilus californianus]|uniref:uncharacterized protein LOC127728788 n=1 Tax=Mytilus californianus TaxID=6549 RepID=UPI002245173A|nr:uncharacterized protein LOC127728788 [Mytilus californianus]